MRDTHSFQTLGGIRATGFELSGTGEAAQINAARMSGGVFSALEVQPLLGRYYSQQEDDQKQQVAVLSYSMWQNRFHGDRNALGTKILLDRKPYEIIGVMPRNFEFPLVPGHLNQSELWVPLSLSTDEVGPNGAASWNFDMIGRLKPGVSSAQAQADAEPVARQTMRQPLLLSSLRFQPSYTRCMTL
jgi:hypothetical protein